MTAPDPRVGEIEARLAAATPGPWRMGECSPCTARGRLEVNIWDDPRNLLITSWCDDDEFHRPDAEFIANAPDDVAYLLAELRKAHEALARVDDLADAFVKRGEHLIEFAKTAPDDVAESLTESGGDFLHKGRLIRAAVAAANGDGQ